MLYKFFIITRCFAYYGAHVFKILEKNSSFIKMFKITSYGFVESFQYFRSSYPHLLEVGGQVLALGDHRDVVVLALLLGQQLEPALHRTLYNLTENTHFSFSMHISKVIF